MIPSPKIGGNSAGSKTPSTPTLLKPHVTRVPVVLCAGGFLFWNKCFRRSSILCQQRALAHGLAYVPLFTVREKLAAGVLATTLDRHTRHVGTFQILWPSGRQRSPKVKAFVDFMAITLFGSGA